MVSKLYIYMRPGFESPIALRNFRSIGYSASHWWGPIRPKRVSVIRCKLNSYINRFNPFHRPQCRPCIHLYETVHHVLINYQALKEARKDQMPPTTHCMDQPNTYKKNPVISFKCFYFKTVTARKGQLFKSSC